MGKGIGFVLFKTTEAARAAMLCDGQMLGDRELRVTRASRAKANAPRKPPPENVIKPANQLAGAARRLGVGGKGEEGGGNSRAASWEGTKSKAGVKRLKGPGAPGFGQGGSGQGGQKSPSRRQR